MSNVIRTRFAPAPTGLMHLGNARSALMNYLFARQHKGTFIIRVEDTDQQRNFDPGAQQILADLAWLNLSYDEGPRVGGNYGPYFQSERNAIYQEKFQALVSENAVYRCFCTTQELERKRERQVALKLPPRYDRTCLKLSESAVAEKLAANIAYVWRLKLPESGTVTINDLSRGTVQFDFKNFSDQPLTREDGSFTFLFANFVDDLTMKITHIFRGEEHITNTAVQATLFKLFNALLPTYWHMPLLCNTDGKKLSKRDFGFSLNDLKQAGYLPEAIDNYLAIIGGSFSTEIMSLDELVTAVDFSHISTASQIKYDVEKLTWVNHKWIDRYDPSLLLEKCLPFIVEAFPVAATLDKQTLTNMLQIIKSDLNTLRDCQQALHFYFSRPELSREELDAIIASETRARIAPLVQSALHTITQSDLFLQEIKSAAKAQQISIKDLFAFVRCALMGQPQGPGIQELITMLGNEESRTRIELLCKKN